MIKDKKLLRIFVVYLSILVIRVFFKDFFLAGAGFFINIVLLFNIFVLLILPTAINVHVDTH